MQGLNLLEIQKKPYGTVAVFKDLYGNLWDLLELKSDNIISKRINNLIDN